MHVCNSWNRTDVARKAGDRLIQLVEANAHKDILLVCAGGSANEVLEYLPGHIPTHCRSLTITVLDERLHPDPEFQNAYELKKLFPSVQCISPFDTIEEGQTVEAYGNQFNAALKAWLFEHTEQYVCAVIGIGSDGHVAGIFGDVHEHQFAERFIDTRALAVGYTVPDSAKPSATRMRITTTAHFLTYFVHHALIYCVGPEKKNVVAQLCELERKPVPPHIFPAALLTRIRSTELYTDQFI